MTKADMREQLKQTRMALSPEEREAKSAAICEKLKEASDWSIVQSLHYFEPLVTLKEVDTAAFLSWLQAEHPTVRLYTSRLIGGNWEIVSVADDQRAEAIQFDAILVPMLGFDPKTLDRIGHGGGHYDRFLSTQPTAQKIGVCFEHGKVDDIPAEPHDIPLNSIITEETIYPQ
jgi:5,10-methenyltetrahydrofolate synthetase